MGRAKGEEHVQLTSSHEVLSFIASSPRTMKEIQIAFKYSCHKGPKGRLEYLMEMGAIESISTLRDLEIYMQISPLGPNPTFLTKVYIITGKGQQILGDWYRHGCNRRNGEPLPLRNCSLCPAPKPKPPKVKRKGHGNFMPGGHGKAPRIDIPLPMTNQGSPLNNFDRVKGR